MTISDNPIERLFFALWPNDDVRQSINQFSQPVLSEVNGKIIPFENWHITLAFLGEVDLSTKQCMQQIAEKVQGNRFSLSLDKLGYWPKPRIFWIGVSQIPEALQDLVNHLNASLVNCGYRPDTRPFQVHLTLMRKAVCIKKLPMITPIVWTVEDFCLVRSILEPSGARYEVIARWALN